MLATVQTQKKKVSSHSTEQPLFLQLRVISMCLCMGKIQKRRVGKRSPAWFVNEISVLKPCFRIYKLSNIFAHIFSVCRFSTCIYVEVSLLLELLIILIIDSYFL